MLGVQLWANMLPFGCIPTLRTRGRFRGSSRRLQQSYRGKKKYNYAGPSVAELGLVGPCWMVRAGVANRMHGPSRQAFILGGRCQLLSAIPTFARCRSSMLQPRLGSVSSETKKKTQKNQTTKTNKTGYQRFYNTSGPSVRLHGQCVG